tara:strand:- start:3000 stop:3224 length:225 start_codon:yes stop_codon:yes gene_type:complete
LEDNEKSHLEKNAQINKYLIDLRKDFEREVNVFSDAVVHKFKLSIWWAETNCSIFSKLSKTNTLMERAIVHLDT